MADDKEVEVDVLARAIQTAEADMHAVNTEAAMRVVEAAARLPPMVTWARLPMEVEEWLARSGFGDTPREDVRFFKKCDISRSDAWDQVASETVESYAMNPWRKAHTAHYWVWVKREQPR